MTIDPVPGRSVSQRLSFLLALSALASLLLLSLSAVSIVDPDVFHEMALAWAALERGSIPTEDLFAFTPTVSPSVHHEWGTGMVHYFIVTRLGSVGLVILKYVLGFAVALLTMKAARLQDAGWEALCLLALIALPLVDIGFTNVRAQFFTLLFVSTLLVMTQWDQQGRRLWIAPWLVLYVVWLNMHGGFVVGALLLACH